VEAEHAEAVSGVDGRAATTTGVGGPHPGGTEGDLPVETERAEAVSDVDGRAGGLLVEERRLRGSPRR
jgi:hypothetical protein